MLNSLMPNERKQQNKSHISLAVPLRDAIQEVSPISSCRHTESHAVFPVSCSLQGCVVEGVNYTVLPQYPSLERLSSFTK